MGILVDMLKHIFVAFSIFQLGWFQMVEIMGRPRTNHCVGNRPGGGCIFMECPPLEVCCASGWYTKDPCPCCQMCAQGEGDACIGPGGGGCAPGLVCGAQPYNPNVQRKCIKAIYFRARVKMLESSLYK